MASCVRSNVSGPRERRNTGRSCLMARVDYVDDPDAPTANSVVPSVTVVVRNGVGNILLIRKADNHLWALPGGGHDIGESITETAVREVREETGVTAEILRLVGTYTNP